MFKRFMQGKQQPPCAAAVQITITVPAALRPPASCTSAPFFVGARQIVEVQCQVSVSIFVQDMQEAHMLMLTSGRFSSSSAAEDTRLGCLKCHTPLAKLGYPFSYLTADELAPRTTEEEDQIRGELADTTRGTAAERARTLKHYGACSSAVLMRGHVHVSKHACVNKHGMYTPLVVPGRCGGATGEQVSKGCTCAGFASVTIKSALHGFWDGSFPHGNIWSLLNYDHLHSYRLGVYKRLLQALRVRCCARVHGTPTGSVSRAPCASKVGTCRTFAGQGAATCGKFRCVLPPLTNYFRCVLCQC